ncbi:purine nucleosidase [Caldanaerobius fijiensis DSM 17918]|uniref:Purine nucleosidase n=1 Tax=Caldanaerobius fijiensis DSM 17918 TaxID=1121256 RepID=A0A1M4ZE02_9THEO|nr:nucleoside hydrolase [Caldanaerobius fijiensis]SHF16250.1 purine nucleosidase [Caldanaerobius fijiensis DSM 17918]
MAIKMIIDTDIGDDIDDALAIAFALNSPEVELEGITTVFRNVKERARLALTELNVFERHIPVCQGIGRPLINYVDVEEIPCQCEAVNRNIDVIESKNAVEFIIDVCMNSKEKITLVPIGPLTNIAVALRLKPDLAERVRIVLMGGYIGAPQPEWNILCDPEAAHIVFNSGADITMVGLDVTLKCRINEEQMRYFDQSNDKRVKFLRQLISLWQGSNTSQYPILHDPLAVASAIDPSLITVKPIDVEIELAGKYTRGMTIPRDGNSVKAAVDVDVKRFMDMFMKRVAFTSDIDIL